MSYSKQNTKRKQALESAQYALEIINLVPRAHVSIGQHKASTNRHVGSGNEIGKSSVKENRTPLHLSFVQGLFIHKCNGCLLFTARYFNSRDYSTKTVIAGSKWIRDH